jgi:hypothetical protein
MKVPTTYRRAEQDEDVEQYVERLCHVGKRKMKRWTVEKSLVDTHVGIVDRCPGEYKRQCKRGTDGECAERKRHHGSLIAVCSLLKVASTQEALNTIQKPDCEEWLNTMTSTLENGGGSEDGREDKETEQAFILANEEEHSKRDEY